MLSILRSVIVFAAVALPAVAHASCTQADLKGVWESYGLGVTSKGGSWLHCTFKVDGAGAITNTSCDQSGGVTKKLTGGLVTMANGTTCGFRGHFRLNGDLNNILFATLSSGGDTASGVGSAQPSGEFQFTMVKR